MSFKGKIRMTKQIKDLWAQFSMGVHCVDHKINLSVQSLSDFIFIARMESFMLNMYGYFNHSLKQHLKF
jgi:hypothetical protein